MSETEFKKTMKRLEAVLDTYGADRARWPAADRLALAEFLARSPEARALVEEYSALDGLIATAARRDDVAAAALAARIVAAAQAEADAMTSAASEKERIVPFRPRATARPAPVRRRLEMAAMAAGVVLVFASGLYAGMAGWLDVAPQEIAGMEEPLDLDDPLFDEDVI